MWPYQNIWTLPEPTKQVRDTEIHFIFSNCNSFVSCFILLLPTTLLHNVCSMKKDTKRSSVLLLRLVSFFYGTDVKTEKCHKRTKEIYSLFLKSKIVLYDDSYLRHFHWYKNDDMEYWYYLDWKISTISIYICRNKFSFCFRLDLLVHTFWEGHKNFAKSSTNFWLQYIQSKVSGRFRKILWPSQNTWTLNGLCTIDISKTLLFWAYFV